MVYLWNKQQEEINQIRQGAECDDCGKAPTIYYGGSKRWGLKCCGIHATGPSLKIALDTWVKRNYGTYKKPEVPTVKVMWRNIVVEENNKAMSVYYHLCKQCDYNYVSTKLHPICPKCRHSGIVSYEQETNPSGEFKKEDNTMDKFGTAFYATNIAATTAIKQGAQQAIAVTAEKAIVEQVKRLLGDSFPEEFYCTPLGEAVVDLGCCYLVHFCTHAFREMPAAETVREYSAAAMVGVSAKSFAPLTKMAQELLMGVAEQAKLAGLDKSDDESK